MNETAVEGQDYEIRQFRTAKGPIDNYYCKHCKFDTRKLEVLIDHYYWRHIMKAVVDSKGQVRYVRAETHPPSHPLYDASGKLITEIQGAGDPEV